MTTADICEYTIDGFEGDVFTNHPDDLGGATRYGITLRFLWAIQPDATARDIENMTHARACTLANLVLMQRARIGEIHDWRVRLVVFDYAFNAGGDDAIPALQEALNLYRGVRPAITIDGALGVDTLALCNSLPPADAQLVACAVLAIRMEFHLARSYAPAQGQFLRGWMVRCMRLFKEVTINGRSESPIGN